MPRKKSRTQRKAEFLQAADALYERMEDWYDAHADASFEEIEDELRRQRRGLMGSTLETLIVGRDSGFDVEPPKCAQCGQPLAFEGYRAWTVKGLEGDSQLERAYYTCPACGEQGFSPLDHKLRLRSDHWSAGAARVAARLGLQAKSFALAAEAFADAVGRSMSADSLAGITEDWGRRIGAQRTAEAERAHQPAHRGERPDQRRVAEVQAISGQANLSTDGAMLLVRGEGWKEVKVVAVSEVQVRPAEARQSAQPSRRDHDALVELSQHSYQAGLWDADTMAKYQYAEGLRRGLDRCRKLSSVNDGALWIKRITATNFSNAQQIIDWRHACDHLWAVANAVCGEHTVQAKQWTAQHLDLLWIGQVTEVVTTLDGMGLEHERWPDLVREAPDYFRTNQERMRYDVFREQALPIGSGTVESAANTVVHHRLKRPGRGWERENGQAMLAALSELHSGRFNLAWQQTFSRS